MDLNPAVELNNKKSYKVR